MTCLLMLSTSVFASSSYEMNCENKDIYTDMGTAELALNTTLTVNGFNDYMVEGGNFKFFIEDAWTDQDVAIDTVANYQNYRPRVYTNHAKFPSISKEFFGIADMIIPHDVLMTGASNFEATFILSWVEDHWGGTVSAECTLK